MSTYRVRVTEMQLLRDEAEVFIDAATPEAAIRVVLDAGPGDEEDDRGRRYCLPDGRGFTLDPENMVVSGSVYAEVIDGGRVIASSLDVVRIDIDPDEKAALGTLLEEAITDTSVQAKAEIYGRVLRKLNQTEDIQRQEDWE